MKNIEKTMVSLMRENAREWIGESEPVSDEKRQRRDKYVQDLWNLSNRDKYVQDLWNLSNRDKDLKRIIDSDKKFVKPWLRPVDENIMSDPASIPKDECITN